MLVRARIDTKRSLCISLIIILLMLTTLLHRLTRPMLSHPLLKQTLETRELNRGIVGVKVKICEISHKSQHPGIDEESGEDGDDSGIDSGIEDDPEDDDQPLLQPQTHQ